MKFSLLLVATLLGCSSCEKVRTLIGKGEKKPPTAAPAPAATPAAAAAPASAPATAPKPYVAGPAVSEISAGDFESFRQQTGKVIIVDFYADWCGPCKQLGPILEQVAASHSGLVLVGKVNVDKSPELAGREGVKSIPDVRIFRDGKEIDRFVGLPPEAEVRRRVESHLKAVESPAPKPAVVEKTKTEAGAAKTKPEKPKVAEPLTRPMPKNWMPEGMKRR